MLCRLSRWLISRAEDREKSLPRFAARHIERCGRCREYAGFVASLSSRFSRNLRPFLDTVPDVPLPPAGGVSDDVRSEDPAFRPRPFVLRPFPAAAAALVLAGSAIALFLVIRRPEPLSPKEKESAIAAVKSLTSAPARFGGLLDDAEASFEKERVILEKSVLSAMQYFQDRLHIKVELRDSSKSM